MTAYADSLRPFVGNANVQAFLRVLREGESSQEDAAYFMRWPGKTFDDLTKHPKIFEPGPNGPSSAAGAYQITWTTYNDFAPRLGVDDFSRQTQDLIAVAIIHSENALLDVYEGRVVEAIQKLGGRWASLPSSTVGQPTVKLARLLDVYRAHGGTLSQPAGPLPPAPSVSSGPPPEPAPAAPSPSEPTMPLPVAVAVGLATELWRILRPTEKVAQVAGAIEKAAPVLLEAARQAVPAAVNEQQAVDQIKANPQLQAQFRVQAFSRWEDIEPALLFEEKSRQEARTFNERWDGDRLIFGQLRFVELLSLIFVLISASGAYLVLTNEKFPAELKGAVVTLILIGGWTAVQQFWLGSSRGSQVKDTTINEQAKR